MKKVLGITVFILLPYFAVGQYVKALLHMMSLTSIMLLLKIRSGSDVILKKAAHLPISV
jgi:hypothetical protein